MAIQIEFYFDFASPYSYLAATQLPALIADTGDEIVYGRFDSSS
jgi:2-hydroxychromene-2-carboxylate isomerase